MTIYIMPALIALALKVYVLFIAHASKTSRVFAGMVLVFALHNATEVIAYLQFASGHMSEFLFRVYYAATLAVLCYMCLYCIEVSKLASLKKFQLPFTLWLALGTVLVLVTDLLVAGVTPISYAVTAKQGPYYWLFSLTTLLSLVFIVTSLIYGYRKSDEHVTQIQCLYNLVALFPVVILGFIVIPMMMFGYQLNAAGFLPICTTLFLLITLKSEDKHGFTDIRRFLPFSRERRMANDVQALISRFAMDQISYKEMSNEFEKIALKHKLDQADDSISQAARLLQMKRSTLYSMLNRHGMKRGEKA